MDQNDLFSFGFETSEEDGRPSDQNILDCIVLWFKRYDIHVSSKKVPNKNEKCDVELVENDETDDDSEIDEDD